MKTTQEIVEDLLLQGKHINKFDLLSMANSVCLAQRILDIKEQKGWNICSKSVPGKGTLKEYWLEPEEIERIKNSPRMVSNNEQNHKDEQLVEPIENIVEKASVSLKNEDIAYEQNQYSYALYQEFLRLKTELRDQFLNVETQLVNGSLISSPNSSDKESMLSLSDRHYELWKHVAKMIRVFGYGYDPVEDPEMYESDTKGQMSYRNLVDCFNKVESGIWKMFNYGLDLKDDLTASDRVRSRLAELEGTIRYLAQKVECADASIIEITPALHDIAHSKDYFKTILVEEKFKLSIRVLNLNDSIIDKLIAKGVETVGDLSMKDMYVLRLWFGKSDALAIKEAMMAMDPYFKIIDERPQYEGSDNLNEI